MEQIAMIYEKGRFYVMTRNIPDSNVMKNNYVYEQRIHSQKLAPYKDVTGTQTTAISADATDREGSSREATPHEIEAYKRAGKPISVLSIEPEDPNALLLEEAKLRFPIGTKYISLYPSGDKQDEPQKVTRNPDWVTKGELMDCGYSYCWVRGTWAEPVEEVQVPKSINEELIAEAKRRYPVGTKFSPIHINKIDRWCIITDNSEFRVDSDGDIYSYIMPKEGMWSKEPKYGNCDLNRKVYDPKNKNKWAQIIPKQVAQPVSAKVETPYNLGDILNHEMLTEWCAKGSNFNNDLESWRTASAYTSSTKPRIITLIRKHDGKAACQLDNNTSCYVSLEGLPAFEKEWQDKNKPLQAPVKPPTSPQSKFVVGDTIELIGGLAHHNPRSDSIEWKTYRYENVIKGIRKVRACTFVQETGIWWYLTSDYGNWVSEDGLRFSIPEPINNLKYPASLDEVFSSPPELMQEYKAPNAGIFPVDKIEAQLTKVKPKPVLHREDNVQKLEIKLSNNKLKNKKKTR